MKPCFSILMSACCALVLMTGCAGKVGKFGDPMRHAQKAPTCVGEILANPDKYVDAEVRVGGVVKTVCDGAGCWMEIAEAIDKEALFVKFSYDRNVGGRVPVSAVGHRAVCEGKLVSTEIPQHMREHYAREIDKPVAAVPARRLQLICPSTEIVGIEPAAPQPCGEH